MTVTYEGLAVAAGGSIANVDAAATGREADADAGADPGADAFAAMLSAPAGKSVLAPQSAVERMASASDDKRQKLDARMRRFEKSPDLQSMLQIPIDAYEITQNTKLTATAVSKSVQAVNQLTQMQ